MGAAAMHAKAAWSFAAAAGLLAAAVLAGVDALAPSGLWSDGLGAVAGVAGAVMLVLRGARRMPSPWVLVAAGVPMGYLVLSTAPEAVSLEPMPVARLSASVAAMVAYLGAAAPLGLLPQYGLCCVAMGVASGFFLLWEPPPPKPVPIARPLKGLKDDLLAHMPAWTGDHQDLPPAIEDALGADTYLNLDLSSRDSPYNVQVFVTYNANAMTNIPHVPWVCMTQAGYRLKERRQDEVLHPTDPGKTLEANVILFHPGRRMVRTAALMVQYFNVGGTYEWNRQMARVRATSGALGREGSYLSQTQVSVFMPVTEAEEALERGSRPYALARKFLETLIPLLERKYYPDLDGSEGGA